MALKAPDPFRQLKPITRHFDKEVEMIWHQTPGVEHDAVNLGLFMEMCKKCPIQTSIGEGPTPPKCAGGDEIAPGFGIIEPL